MIYSRVTNAFELKCEFTNSKDYYCCEAQNLMIDQPHTIMTSVSGNHLLDLRNADVTYLSIFEQKVKFLPINFAKYFPNLKRIQVMNSNLEYITANDFLGLTHLTNINMGFNKLKELPCGVFNANRKLVQLHFENNHLTKIGADVFKPLTLLKNVHFRNNECITRDVNDSRDVPALLDEITRKCSISCEISFINLNLKIELDALKVVNLKIIKEKDELNQNFKDLDIKYIQTIENARVQEEKFNSIISNLENNLSENKNEIKKLEITVNNITEINHNLRNRFCFKNYGI